MKSVSRSTGTQGFPESEVGKTVAACLEGDLLEEEDGLGLGLGLGLEDLCFDLCFGRGVSLSGCSAVYDGGGVCDDDDMVFETGIR